MSKLISLCIYFTIYTFAIPLINAHKAHNNKLNALSPQEMAQLISSQNPEGYTMVECSINDLILIIQTRPDWAPLGQKRFVELVNDRYYDDAALFRAINNFLVQFGLASTKAMRQKWAGRELNIADDPHIDVPFTRGIMSFAGSGADSRGTQIFFTMAEISTHLGKESWEVPFGKVIYGDDALKSINTEYDDNVKQNRIWSDGYDYLTKEFPKLSYIEYCRVINKNEMMYYVGSVKENKNDDKHDIEKQLYGNDGGNETSMGNGDGTAVFAVKIVALVIGIGIMIFVIVKLLTKTPGKKH